MANAGKVILFSVLITLICSFLLVWYLDLLDIQAFYGISIIITEYTVGYVYVVYMWKKDQLGDGDKKNIAYCWKRTGELLQQMPNGVSIEWQSGEGRRSEMRNFYDNTTKRSYRAFFGLLTRTRQPVVVIYDMDLDDIARYEASPTPQLLENPWHEFKPFYNEMAQQANMQRMMGKGRGRRGRGFSRYGGFENIPVRQDNLGQDVDQMANDIVEGGSEDE